MEKIYRDTKAVKILAANARGEKVDATDMENTLKLLSDLSGDLNPVNKYRIGQLIGFAVNEIVVPQTKWLEAVADVKRVPIDGRAEFNLRMGGIKAFVQAKGSTTPRTKVYGKTITIDTTEVSARPILNIVEMATGQADMAQLIRDAAFEMEMKYYTLAYQTLNASLSAMSAPYYGTGAGIVPAVLDPMIEHWMRMGGATIIGDIAVISKLAAETGFTASATQKQFADSIITEQNQTGHIGYYKGAKVVNLLNPYIDGTETAFAKNRLFIVPSAISPDNRPLKIVFQGDVSAMEHTDINDRSFETRLDQWVGVAMVYGENPYASMYEDSSITA